MNSAIMTNIPILLSFFCVSGLIFLPVAPSYVHSAAFHPSIGGIGKKLNDTIRAENITNKFVSPNIDCVNELTINTS